LKSQHLNLVQHDEENQKLQYKLPHSPLQEYIVTLSNAESIYILARNSMDAAYNALELSEDRHCKLIDVRLREEW